MEVLVLRIEGYTYPEISQRLRDHPHPDALRRRWFRLRQKIAKAIAKGGSK
jgi:DNA-directed RNA polymerase specialized sigma24 family protein